MKEPVIGPEAGEKGGYYYFNVVRAMYWDAPQSDAPPIKAQPLTKATILVLTIAVIALGVYPRPLLSVLPQAEPAVAEVVAEEEEVGGGD